MRTAPGNQSARWSMPKAERSRRMVPAGSAISAMFAGGGAAGSGKLVSVWSSLWRLSASGQSAVYPVGPASSKTYCLHGEDENPGSTSSPSSASGSSSSCGLRFWPGAIDVTPGGCGVSISQPRRAPPAIHSAILFCSGRRSSVRERISTTKSGAPSIRPGSHSSSVRASNRSCVIHAASGPRISPEGRWNLTGL